MWKLGLTCAKSQHVYVQHCWVSRVNSSLKKLHFEELGGDIQSAEFSQHHYAAINTAIKTLQHNPRSSECERRKPRLTVRWNTVGGEANAKTFHEYKCFEPVWPSLDCAYAGVCAGARWLPCACVSIQGQQLHSISLLRLHSCRSSGSTARTQIRHRDVSEAILSRGRVVLQPPPRKWAGIAPEGAPSGESRLARVT